MRSARAGRMLAAVTDQLLHIAIDVSLDDDRIHGQVGDGVRQPRQFRGWLALIGPLDELLGSPRQPATPSGDRAPGEEDE